MKATAQIMTEADTCRELVTPKLLSALAVEEFFGEQQQPDVAKAPDRSLAICNAVKGSRKPRGARQGSA